MKDGLLFFLLLWIFNVSAADCEDISLKERAIDLANRYSSGADIFLEDWFTETALNTAFIKENRYSIFFSYARRQAIDNGGIRIIKVLPDKNKACEQCAIETTIEYNFESTPFEGSECWSLEDGQWKLSDK